MKRTLTTISLLAALLACSRDKLHASSSAAQPAATQSSTLPITFKRQSLCDANGYEGMTLWVDVGEDNISDGAVVTDLRSAVNISPDEKRMIDSFSFSSMIQRGSVPETNYFLTKEGVVRIKDSGLEEELGKRVPPPVEWKIASEECPRVEPEATSVRIRNSSPLISFKEVPTTLYYFRRATLSPEKELPNLSKEEAEKIKSFGDRTPLVCLKKLEGEEKKRYEEDVERYRHFSVEPIFRPSMNNLGYSCAGLGIRFDGQGFYDVVGVLDLRAVQNSEDINENDLRAMAFWGDFSDVYSTFQAAEQAGKSRFLRTQLDMIFTPKTIPKTPLPSSGQEINIIQGVLEELLPLRTQKQKMYFHPPGIFPCRD